MAEQGDSTGAHAVTSKGLRTPSPWPYPCAETAWRWQAAIASALASCF